MDLTQAAQTAFYGAEAMVASKVKPSLMFSYASPSQLKAAKLEAMQMRIHERLQAHSRTPANPYEGLETEELQSAESAAYPFDNGESGRLKTGGLEQYQMLVVPPVVGTGGTEKPTAKLVVHGAETAYIYRQGVQKPKAVGVGVKTDAPSSPVSGRSAAKGGGAADKQEAPQREHLGPAQKAPRPENPLLKSLKSSVAAPFIPVAQASGLVPAKGLSTTAQIVEAVSQSLKGMLVRPLTAHPANNVQEEDLVEAYKMQTAAKMLAAAGLTPAHLHRGAGGSSAAGQPLSCSGSMTHSTTGDRNTARHHAPHSLSHGYSKFAQIEAKHAVLSTSQGIVDALTQALQENQVAAEADEGVCQFVKHVPGFDSARGADAVWPPEQGPPAPCEPGAKRPVSRDASSSSNVLGAARALQQQEGQLRSSQGQVVTTSLSSFKGTDMTQVPQLINQETQSLRPSSPLPMSEPMQAPRPRSMSGGTHPPPTPPATTLNSSTSSFKVRTEAMNTSLPLPRDLTERGHSSPSPSVQPPHVQAPPPQPPLYGQHAARPVSAQYSPSASRQSPQHPQQHCTVQALYQWQSAGPRHRDPAPSSQPPSASAVRTSMSGQAPQLEARASAPGPGSTRPPSGSSNHARKSSQGETAPPGRWMPAASPRFRFSMSDLEIGEATARSKPFDEAVRPLNPHAQACQANSVMPATRKTTSDRLKNGAIASQAPTGLVDTQMKTDMQYRVLQLTAYSHGFHSPDQLLATHQAFSESITLTSAAFKALALEPRPPPRPNTAPPVRITHWRGGASKHLQASVSCNAHAPPQSSNDRGAVPFVYPPLRSGSAPAVRSSSFNVSRPQSAVPLSAAGIRSYRTRPPSAGDWGGSGPHLASFVADSLLDEECEVLWTDSVNPLGGMPGVAIQALAGFPMLS